MNRQPDKNPLYDVEKFRAPSRFWRRLLGPGFILSEGWNSEDLRVEQQVVLYRTMLLVMLVANAVVCLGSVLGGRGSSLLVWSSGAVLAVLSMSSVMLYARRNCLMPPIVALSLTTAVVLWSVAAGADRQALWLFPLLIAAVSLLPFRAAVAFGLLTLVLLFLAEAESAVGDHLAMNAALAATFLLSLSIMQMLVRQTDELADLALSDPLTGAYNRRYLLPQARRHLADYQRYARLSAMMLMDIDHFKEINDELGHFAGDGVLKALVDLIDTRIRGVDTLFRLGGEEFVVLLSEVGAESAHRIAEELRSRIASADLLPDRRITVSIGVCDVSVVDSAEDWIQKTDAAMYDAKRAGRDQVEVVRASLGVGAEVDGSIPMWR